MESKILTSLHLYEGGTGVIHTKSEKHHVRNIKVDDANEIVSATKVTLEIGKTVIASEGRRDISADVSENSITIPFDEITEFHGGEYIP